MSKKLESLKDKFNLKINNMEIIKTPLVEKLALIQKELKAPKNKVNSFGQYKYRSCEDILEAVKPLLAKNNIALTIVDDIRLIGDRYYIEATAIISDNDESIKTKALAREPEEKRGMDPSQITGATSSYARKYALNGLFAIDDQQDADAMEPKPRSNSNPIKEPTKKDISVDNFQKLLTMIGKGQFSKFKALQLYNLTEDQRKKIQNV